MKRIFLFIFLVSSLFLILINQESSPENSSNYEIIRTTDKQSKGLEKETENEESDHPEIFAEIEKMIRTGYGQEAPTYQAGYQWDAYNKMKNNAQRARATDVYTFVERGPANYAGRTRALIVDAADPTQNTWFAGAASGGIWKTTNGGATWKTSSVGLPNLGTNALAQSATNPNVLYAGTGEQNAGNINGQGLFKSTNHGESWFPIINPLTIPDLQMIGRITVNPTNENQLVVVGRNSSWDPFTISSGIYKSIDGGISWSKSLTFQNGLIVDMVASDYDNWDIQYASVRHKGIYKSIDGGNTWSLKSSGLNASGRIELSISTVAAGLIWAVNEDGNVFLSKDGAETWSQVSEAKDEDNFDVLGGQGSYDNAVLAHPFDSNKVYVGGVNIWEFTATETSKTNNILEKEDVGTDVFMSYINFSGDYSGGTLDVGAVGYANIVNIEVRFGQGTQKAHRFTVSGMGAGVPDANYIYQDYVEVPFQVWDLTNDQQLMVSFRDQQEDSTWNLIPALTTGPAADQSREYLFIHLIDYAELPDSAIALNGGQTYNRMYFFWPVGVEGFDFDPISLPTSNLKIGKVQRETIIRETFSIADAYRNYEGNNSIAQYLPRSEDGIHPDHHSFHALNLNQNDSTFNLLSTNDGGIYLSKNSKQPGHADKDFEYVSLGYNTTQLYGADKMPGEDRYIGGTQDNGSFYTPKGTSSSASTNYNFALGGDGFEAIWNNRDGNKIIGSIYFNRFYASTNGGTTWQKASSGIAADDGPFLSRLSNSRRYPDRLFAIGKTGVYVSNDFGNNWKSTNVDSDYWLFTNYNDIKVSMADPKTIWTGGYLSEDYRIFVSQDAGASFEPTENYSEFNMGNLSGLATHPSDAQTAFALFSIDRFPKILKTSDLGQTWTDISGFDGTSKASTRGFPNVATHTLLCFPNDPDHIWVGTEIGIVESLDGGNSWALLSSNLPLVKIYSMKIQDDQIVLGTYGRGIWSVTLQEVKENIIFAPNIDLVSIDTEGKTSFLMTYSDTFDSTQIVVNNQVIHTLAKQELGTRTFTIDNLKINGLKKIKALAYSNGAEFESVESTQLLYEVFEAKRDFKHDFNNAYDDFAFQGFSSAYKSGFPDIALHSDHDYPLSTELVTVLKTPIIIGSTNATITFKEVAIVETGETGTVYGDAEFWDYVIVEGSSDGINWIPFLAGYDANAYPEWAQFYNTQKDGTSDLYKDRTIDMLETFEPADIVLIRFRLYSDPGVSAWGWVIDDLYIQDVPLALPYESPMTLSIYPNPISTSAKIKYKLLNKGILTMMDLQGKILREYELEASTNQLLFEKGDLKSGIYLVRLESAGIHQIKKIYIQ
ncbi:MAG: T9SS type A sorting domain-containing protein [Flammeovirgaceae bacterium]|nr:T9SS type A sorting domain-containing protein [Flammeovirgaceae bacterium]